MTKIASSPEDDSVVGTTTNKMNNLDFFKRFKRFNPLEPSLGITSFFLVTILLFIGCFSYIDYKGLRSQGTALLGFGVSSSCSSSSSPSSSSPSSSSSSSSSSPLSSSSFSSSLFNEPSVVEFLEREGDSCDVFDGNWVWDENYPLYDSSNCSYIDQGFRCLENGRPDNFFTKWRWQPKDCNLPRFDGRKMLETLRNKRLVFVGDSIGRNQWESLLCMLTSVVTNKSSVYEINGNPITKHSGFLSFKFEEYNCTISYYRSTYLVVQGHPPPGAPENVSLTLRLDVMDWSSRWWKNADVLVLNTGHWWNYQKTVKVACYFQVGDEVIMKMDIQHAFRMAIETLINWITTEVDTTKTYVLFRTYSPVHFRGGDWNTGGGCNLESLPELGSVPQVSDRHSQTIFNILSENANKSGVMNLKLLNITQMTLRRKDGHASIYHRGPGRKAPLQLQDCSHWCLPGVPDSWNELLYALILKKMAAI